MTSSFTAAQSLAALGARNFRVGGSGFTVFHWMSKPIGFARSLSVISPQPVAPPTPIQPLDASHPLEIIVPQAVGAVTLQVQLFELYNEKVWDEIMRTADASNTPGDNRTNVQGRYNDLQSVLARMANIGRGVSVTKYVYPPNKIQGGTRSQRYAETFHNVRITDVRDDENIEISTMEVVKNLTMMGTHSTNTPYNG